MLGGQGNSVSKVKINDDDDSDEEVGLRVFLFIKGSLNSDMKLANNKVFSTEDKLAKVNDFQGFKLSKTKIIFYTKIQVFYFVIKEEELKSISLKIQDRDVAFN
jgi:hypothetical protein